MPGPGVRAWIRGFGVGLWCSILGYLDFELFFWVCAFHATGFASDKAPGFKVRGFTSDVDENARGEEGRPAPEQMAVRCRGGKQGEVRGCEKKRAPPGRGERNCSVKAAVDEREVCALPRIACQCFGASRVEVALQVSP
jgi:hypothetical protein